jgi:hypothetical protein
VHLRLGGGCLLNSADLQSKYFNLQSFLSGPALARSKGSSPGPPPDLSTQGKPKGEVIQCTYVFFPLQPKGADVIYVFLSASQSELTFFQPKWADSQKVKRELPAKEAGSPAKMG